MPDDVHANRARVAEVAKALGLPVGTPPQAVIDAAVKRLDEPDASHMAELRRRLGLPAATPAQEVVAAAARRLDEVDAQDARYEREIALAASLGRDAPPPRRGAGAKVVLDWAQATGRIAAASRPRLEDAWQSDPEGTEATVRILARTSQPLAAAGWPAAPPPIQTASGLDVSSLPPGLRPAAARCSDRGIVYRLVEDFGNTTEHVPPVFLRLSGYDGIAADVERDEHEAHAAAVHASTQALEDANEVHQRQLMAEADRRREEAMARYQEPSE